MSDAGPATASSFEDLLTSLEQAIAELARGTAPLEELMAAHERAGRVLADAQARLEELKKRADEIAGAMAG